jgi:hypothetical protein
MSIPTAGRSAQTVRPRDGAVVLSRRPGGWQAVDLLAGDLVR